MWRTACLSLNTSVLFSGKQLFGERGVNPFISQTSVSRVQRTVNAMLEGLPVIDVFSRVRPEESQLGTQAKGRVRLSCFQPWLGVIPGPQS